MKFGKLLKDLTETNPQMSQQPLIRYKELKKHLKNIKKQQDAAGGAGEGDDPAAAQQQPQQHQLQQQEQQQEQQQPAAAPQPQPEQQQQQPAEGDEVGYQPGQELPADLSAEEQAFINMLNEDLLGFNRFFMDKEEEAVITLQALADRIEGSRGQPVEAQELKAALVDFHGEMVLLLHWSLLNYAAVVKILKKHDKQSGLLLRAPYLANVLQQPFYSTSIMSRLVKMAEGHIESLVAQEAPAADTAAAAEGSSRQPTPEAALGAAAAAAVAGPGPSSEAAAAAAAVAGSSKHDSGGADQQQPQQQQPDALPDALPDAAAAGGAAAGDAAAAGLNAEAETDTDTEELLAGTAVCARTRVALQTWQQLCSNASTPSTILPANCSQALVRALNVRQRWAKLVNMAPIMQQAGMEGSAQLGGGAGGDDSTAAAAAADGGGGSGVQQEGESGGGASAAVAAAAHAGQKHKDETADEGQLGASAEEPSKRQKVDS